VEAPTSLKHIIIHQYNETVNGALSRPRLREGKHVSYIAMACASKGDGIRVNSVHPGIIDTPIWGKIPAEAVTSGPPIDGSPTSSRRKLAHELGISKAMTHGCIMLLGSRAADLNKHRTQCEPLLIEVGWSAARIAGIGIQNFM
jgi:hypothetical protein